MAYKFKNNINSFNIRLIIILIGIALLFVMLLIKLYFLQIVNGELLNGYVKGTISKEITLDSPRGNIYDKFGRPLAVNNSSFTVNIDPSVSLEEDILNEIILRTMNLLERNNEKIVDDFPISKEKPYVFLFNGSPSLEKTWKNDMNLEKNDMNLNSKDITAEQAFNILRKKFNIDASLSDQDARKIMIVRSELHKKRFSRYIPITLAYDVSKKTIGEIEENYENFISINIDVEATRDYPQKQLFSHTLGYIRGINTEELEEYKKNGFKNYDMNDIVGKEGIEKAFEPELKGTDGVAYYEVDTMGRIIRENQEMTVPPIPGNDIFLTSDANLTKVAFDALETELANTIKNRLLGKNKNINYTPKDIFSAMVYSNNLEIKKILASKDGMYQYYLKKYIQQKDEIAIKDEEKARKILSKGIKDGQVSQTNIIMSIYEQGIIKPEPEYQRKILAGNITPLQFLLDKLDSKQITPQMTGLPEAPATGSVFVTDIKNGDVLVSTSYPSYDNNKFVNNFDNNYYAKVSQDPTQPLTNRPLTEPRAPGSIFKMIAAVAGLQTGFITPNTTIYDKGTFTEAGKPYARCWIGNGKGSHNHVNVAKSLEVSCNYFYYDLSFRMGIDILNKYMRAFGLDNKTGVEIYELYDHSSMEKYPTKISSPEYKRYITKLRNPDVKESDLKWTAGNTIRTAIGQDFNNYTSAIMTKYISTLANGGDRYSLHFLKNISNSKGEIIKQYEPNIETNIEISETNLKAVHKGMYQVTKGESGTLRRDFKDFPINVAAKSGTAQESASKNNHNVFTCFVPYENPQIAMTVIIPYGDDTYSPAAKVAKKIITEYFAIEKEPEKIYYNTLTP